MKLMGYRRPDGSFGVRNHVLILPCSLCASETARFASSLVPGTVYIPNQGGCSLSRRDLRITVDTLAGLAANPNIYGTVLIGNGCEVVQASLLAAAIMERTNKPLECFVIRECGGSVKAVERAAAAARSMWERAQAVQREAGDVSELILGTECGGSDPTSGLAANPVVGECSDLMVAAGGTSILSETPELIGAETPLAARCESAALSRELLNMISAYEGDFLLVGENPRSGNPTPGNLAGGITTLEEKSLGCVHKGGTATVREVLPYSRRPVRKGLVVMDTPGQDIASIAGMAAAGAQVVVFTTGHGTPTGFGILPVIKLTANGETARLMADNIDLDCSSVIAGECTIETQGQLLFQMVLEVAAGRKTKAEALGFNDMSMARHCNFA